MKSIMVLLLIGMLTGCTNPEAGDDMSMRVVERGHNLNIYKDTRTGCDYITSYRGGITKRLYSDGTQVCD